MFMQQGFFIVSYSFKIPAKIFFHKNFVKLFPLFSFEIPK